MTTLERRLHDALMADAIATEPSPDLFARVRGSIADDRRRRARLRARIGVVVLLIGALISVIYGTSTYEQGRLLMEWWVLEAITTVVLIGLALWLGPFIKRFGRAYAADVFKANPATGKSFILLADIVYYLIFGAYILFSVRFQQEREWTDTVGAAQLQWEVGRLGGILLIIGVLHGANIILMPVIGRLFSLNRRLDAEQIPAGDE
ncbi:MAG: hypothetical protein OEY98_10030 [Acidimicrobiia bacterium]|nr:hypothetical protein [Acidimicrobiia bacterium]